LSPCPTIGKSGVYFIASDGCNVGFTSEYITVEGFGFGCATIDFALDITCNGFSSLTALVQDVMLGSWLSLDFSITFTEDSKSFDGCLSFSGLTNDCFTIEVGLPTGPTASSAPSITGLALHGIGLEYTWNGLTFTSYTELTEYSTLFSDADDWEYIDGAEEVGFLVPVGGYKACAVGDPCCDGTEAVCRLVSENVYALKCVPLERIKLWEMFSFEYESDACCGGAFSLAVDTYFGDFQTLDFYAYATKLASETGAYGAPVYLYGTTGASFTDATTAPTCDTVSVDYDYKADTTMTSLFAWAKSEVEVSFGLGSNFTIDLGASISAFGWETLDFGFEATF